MMSVSNVSGGAAASGYYRAEGYYIEGSPEAEAAASWFGKGAEELAEKGQTEFSGRVDDQTFSAMLEGHAPPVEKDEKGEWKEGQTLGRVVNGERQHRPGIDLTFSASKSVSILGLVAGDERVIAAHDEAVKAAMSYVEDRFVTTRREVDGKIVKEPGKMVAGLFRHDTSRALDPQLHTHAVIQNMVLKDNKWTALSNEEIYRNKMLIGAVYRNELAMNLEKAGFDVRRQGKDGITEIKGVSKDLMEGFSKRRKEIEETLDKDNRTATAQNSAWAALATRPNKRHGVDRGELREAWQQEAKALGVSLDQLKEVSDRATHSLATRLPGVTKKNGIESALPQNPANTLVEYAIEHVSERSAVYSQGDILRTALNRSTKAGIYQLENSITQKEHEGRLVPVHVHDWKEREVTETVRGEGFTGNIVKMGAAPYQNDPKKRDSYFVTVSTAAGDRTVWGVGLEKALTEQKAIVGSSVHLTVGGQTPIQVKNEKGEWVEAHRNEWTANVIEREPNPEGKNVEQERQTVRLYTDDQTLAHERMAIREFRKASQTSGVKLSARRNSVGLVERSGEKILERALAKSSLSDGQKEAVILGLTGKGRFRAVQGHAGTGKTFMLETLRSHAEKNGYQMEALAPTNKAVGEMASVADTPTTVASFLLRGASQTKADDKSKTILVVDEAGMLSTKDMRAVLEVANSQKYARVILVGDTKQLSAVSAGSPFAQLQKAGLPTAMMTDIQRQRNEDTKAAVLFAIRGEVKAAFEKIGDIRTPGEDRKIPQEIAQTWLNLHSEVRERTGIVVLTNKVREAVNKEIRETLKDEGRIGREDTQLNSLTPLSFTKAEAKDAASYKAGDIVQSLAKIAGLERNGLYRVTDENVKRNTITVMPEKGGEPIEVKLGNGQDAKVASQLVAYQETPREFAVGDRVKFAITDKENRAINGLRGQITELSDSGVKVKSDKGEEIFFRADSLAARGLDHTYAATAHDFQGATVEKIIVGMTANEHLSDQKSFYVNISRAKDTVTLITDKPDDLADKIEKNTGERPTALDAYLQKHKDDHEKKMAEQAPYPAKEQERDAGNVSEILQQQEDKMKAAERSDITNDRTLNETLKEIEQKQIQKEGPIR